MTLAGQTLSETQRNATFYLSKPELRKSPLVPGLCRVFYLSGLIAHFLITTCFATPAQINAKMLEKDETEKNLTARFRAYSYSANAESPVLVTKIVELEKQVNGRQATFRHC